METEQNYKLREKVETLKNEVDALQINILKQNKPWYKNIPIILSIMALLFSFGTTYVSNNRIARQETHGLKAELRTLLQRMATLPKDNFELNQKYLDDHQAISFIGSLINQENTILVNQAVEIAHKLPTEQITSIEYYSLANALQSAYRIDEAEEFFKLAIETATDFNSEIGAIRTYANLLFLKNKISEGRKMYEVALAIFTKYDDFDEFTKSSTHIITELSWATAEANVGMQNNINQHLIKAEEIVSSMAPGPMTEQYRGQINQARSNFAVLLN